MHFMYTILIALANNLDNIGVRIAYSIRGIKITVWKNLWISVITFVISSFAAYSGALMTTLMNRRISSLISMLLLTAIGLWIMLGPFLKKNSTSKNCNNKIGNNIIYVGKEEVNTEKKNIYEILKKPETADMDKSNDIDFKEATILGIALSLNNIGGGLSAGMIGLNTFFVGFFSAIISFLALWAGNYITELFNKLNIGNKAAVLAGLLLIFIGIKQML